MSSGRKDYRGMIGYEDLYLINSFGRIKALDRGYGKVKMVQKTPVITIKGKTRYAIIRDKNYKNRKINIDLMIKNIFGRQKEIIPKEKFVYAPEVKPFVKKSGPNNAKERIVLQWKDNIPIKEFKNIKEASEELMIDRRYISDCIYGIRPNIIGFQWSFKDEVLRAEYTPYLLPKNKK
jgi:hypothetical protein